MSVRPARCAAHPPPRLLIVPGLNGSPPDHWQSWLEAQRPRAVRVVQRDWGTPDLDRWADGIRSTLARRPGQRWIAVAHSFGVLALTRALIEKPSRGIAAALLVAPADPQKFGLGDRLTQAALPLPTTLVLSRTDPWLRFESGQQLALQWASRALDLGDAGHINIASGHRTLPLARQWVEEMEQRCAGAAAVQATGERAAASSRALGGGRVDSAQAVAC